MIGETARNAGIRRRNYSILSTVLVFISFLLLLSSREGSSLGNVRSMVDDAITPVLNIAVAPVRQTEKLIQNFENRSTAAAENEKLKIELSRLKDVENRANTLALQLVRFEGIFNADFGENITDVKIPARAVMETNGPFVRSALLNVGLNKGVTESSAVMTTDGFLGRIIKVGKRSSRVLLLGDLNSRIAVMSLRSGERAIMMGDNSDWPTTSP